MFIYYRLNYIIKRITYINIMEQINFNEILDRTNIVNNIINILKHFELNKSNKLIKRGIYIYGSPGIGKTTFIKNILKSLDYDIICYDAGNIRNKSVIENITKDNMSDTNVLSLFQKKKRKMAIIMDEIDGMNNGDKGGINALIKLIRPKKTKKQKKENSTMIPIICIGSYKTDKKIKEIIKICNTIELKKPTNIQIHNILNIIMPDIHESIINNILLYIDNDIRKLKNIHNIYLNHKNMLTNDLIINLLQIKNYNEDTKKITFKLLTNYYNINQHNILMNETDRTSVGLLFHENIIDCLNKLDKKNTIPFYHNILDNFCFADYMDRLTFQKQIWIFNEMSSLIKTFYNNYIYHNNYKDIIPKHEIRFTKVLTKYSTEYNNILFIQNLCKILNMDKKDLFSFFIHIKNTKSIDDIYDIFNDNNYDITKLDINRMYRYLCI